MTGDELKAERIELGLTQEEFAEILGTTRVTVARWETSKAAINEGWARLGLAEARRRGERRRRPDDGRYGPKDRRTAKSG